MTKVVVTGGAGFIGSNLAEALAKRDYRVTILDNLSTGKMENIEPLLEEARVEFVHGDITDLPLLREVFEGAKYIFHEAALARVQRSIDDPVPTNEANITGSLNVLLAARDNKVSRVIYASSSSIYGGTPVLPQHEGLMPNPLNPYAVSKMAAEYYCEIFRDIYGLSTSSLRYFNVYGPKQDPHSEYGTAVVAFLARVFQNLPPIIHGDGEQSRDLTFIDDVVQANIKAAENNAAGVYNIGSSGNYTINKVAGLILKLTGKEHLKPVYTEPRVGDPRQTMADVSRAKSFGYEPQYDLEKGLEQTIARFKL